MSTTAEVLVRGRWRQRRAVQEAQRNVFAVADALRAASRALSGVNELETAARTLQAKARALERPPEVLSELVRTATVRSGLPASDATFERLRLLAEQRGEPAPIRVRTPTFEPKPLAGARIASAADGKALYNLLTILLEEANLHGMVRADVRMTVEGARFVLRVGNEKRVPPRQGVRGSGGARIERFARRLPGGRLDLRDAVDPSFVKALGGAWFGVQVSCSAAILSGFPNRAAAGG